MKKIYLIATVVAIITGIAVFLFATQLRNDSTQSTQANMVAVVIAATDIAENSKITEEMLTTAMFPVNTVPSSAVRDKNYLINKIAKYPVVKGEQFFENSILIIGDVENKELSDRVKEGYRAYTISVDEVNGISGYLRIGDRIDIIINKTRDGVSTTAYCMQDINIIAIGNSSQYPNGVTEINNYTTITLEVSTYDSLVLTNYLNLGLCKIILRGFGDHEIVDINEFIDEVSTEASTENSIESFIESSEMSK